MSKIVVVDDHDIFLKIVSKVIKNYYYKKGLPLELKVYNKADLLIYDLNDKIFYDIYLLDIVMPESSGIQLAQLIRQQDGEAIIVFITLHMDFLLKGYDVNAYQYIPKTEIEEKLPETLKSIQRKLEINKEQFLVITTNSRYEKIILRDIYYIYKKDKNVHIVTANGDTFLRETLKQVYEKLDKEQFLFIDRGYIVNLLHVMKLNSNEILLRNRITLCVSRTHLNQVKKSIHKYWKEFA